MIALGAVVSSEVLQQFSPLSFRRLRPVGLAVGLSVYVFAAPLYT